MFYLFKRKFLGSLHPRLNSCIIAFNNAEVRIPDYDVATETGFWVDNIVGLKTNGFKSSGITFERQSLFVCQAKIAENHLTPGKFNPATGYCHIGFNYREVRSSDFKVLMEEPEESSQTTTTTCPIMTTECPTLPTSSTEQTTPNDDTTTDTSSTETTTSHQATTSEKITTKGTTTSTIPDKSTNK